MTHRDSLARAGLLTVTLGAAACTQPAPASEAEATDLPPVELANTATGLDEPPAIVSSTRLVEPVEGGTPMVALFVAGSSRECPDGWREAEWARGRLLMATTNPERVGLGAGAGFRPGQGMAHRHAWHTSVDYTSSKQLRLTKGSSLTVPFTGGGHSQYGVSGDAETGLPFLQMLVCERDSPATDEAFVDSMPMDTVALFRSTSCPRSDGGDRLRWEPYAASDGRFVVPLAETGTHERSNEAAPWRTGPEPGHDHGVAEQTFELTALVGDGNECHPWDPNRNDGPYLEDKGAKARFELGRSQRRKPDGGYEYADVDVPYVELLACKKAGTARRNDQSIPRGFTYFLAAADCATEYKVPAAAGRFLVGLPEQGEPNQAYGGPPLASQEERVHRHPMELFDVDMNTLTRGVGDGSTSYGIASVARITARLMSNPSGPRLPYIQLAHCWPTSPDEAPEYFSFPDAPQD